MRTDVELWQAAVSLVLIAIVVGVSIWQRLGLERPVLWATVRATAQLLGVGALFTVIFESGLASLWSGALGGHDGRNRWCRRGSANRRRPRPRCW